MTTEIRDDVFVHKNRITKGGTTVDYFLDGSLTITVENREATVLDVFNDVDRLALARFLLKDVVYGPQFTLERFIKGTVGGNSIEERERFVESFGEDWRASKDATDLWTWINHSDSQNLMGAWDERIKAYYAARGY